MKSWILALAAVMTTTALADEAPIGAPAEPSATAAAATDQGTETTTFQPRHKENLPGEPFVVGAYMVIWAGLFFYLVTLRRRQARLDGEIAHLRAALERHDRSSRAGS